MSQEQQPALPGESTLRDVISSISEPGINSGVVRVMNFAFVAGMVPLGFLSVLTKGNLAVVGLFIVHVTLFVAMQR